MANPIDELEPDYINLLVCKQCKDIREVPYWKGGKKLPEPGRYDQSENPWLAGAIGSCEREGHFGVLTDCLTVAWMGGNAGLKEEILNKIKQQILGGGSTGLDVFGTGFYNLKATFTEDAGNCYNLHMRPKGQCIDYKSEKKILKPDTEKERMEIGLGSVKSKTYLCDFCPVKMYNQKRAYSEKGFYK
jgi:hypothetical protein